MLNPQFRKGKRLLLPQLQGSNNLLGGELRQNNLFSSWHTPPGIIKFAFYYTTGGGGGGLRHNFWSNVLVSEAMKIATKYAHLLQIDVL